MPELISSFTGEYDFLSNFYFVPIKHEGIKYPSVEHAFQAIKTFDRDERKRIASLPTPGMAKRAGNNVKLRANWNRIRIDVMRALLSKKFQHSELRAKLLATGDSELVEGNSWGDVFWGVSMATGAGQNHLGKLLMELREGLRAGAGD